MSALGLSFFYFFTLEATLRVSGSSLTFYFESHISSLRNNFLRLFFYFQEMAVQPKQYKAWCFTWNNPTLTTDQFRSAITTDWSVKYAVAQLESGDAGTKHFQGYVEFGKVMRLTGVKKLLQTAHWEQRMGTREQARDYCQKADSRLEPGFEVGDFAAGGQGRRNDLASAVAMVKESGNLKAVMDEMPEMFVKYGRGLRELAMAMSVPRDDPPEVFICYGPTGCGKSRLSRQEGNYWVDPLGSGAWFDGYNGEDNAIFDDFDGNKSHTRLKDFLRILDRYGLRVPVKGGFINWTPKRIWITTNYHPRDWWDWTSREAQYPALQRRITRIIHWRAWEPEPILIDRHGRPELWKRWWHGPSAYGNPANAALLGPLDNYIEREDPEDWKFDFVTGLE